MARTSAECAREITRLRGASCREASAVASDMRWACKSSPALAANMMRALKSKGAACGGLSGSRKRRRRRRR